MAEVSSLSGKGPSPVEGRAFFKKTAQGGDSLDKEIIRRFLERYKAGEISLDEGTEALARLPFEEMRFAHVDHLREIRQGFPEVVYAAGKTASQVLAIMRALANKSGKSVMATRVSPEQAAFVKRELPAATYDETARVLYIRRPGKPVDETRRILVVTAGTSDMPVAAEAALTAELWGNAVDVCHDIGVAGIHRLFAHIDAIERANVLIVVAGMEGALASVVGGLTAKPVIAVPTSVGYGASFQGLSALLAMLNSCAAGVAVMNIDNGYGAGVLASKINRMR
jgi:NCAIR mutase (PurE)-related protein